MFLRRDLHFMLCSCNLHLLRAQRIIGFFILITRNSVRSENPVMWLLLKCVWVTPYSSFSYHQSNLPQWGMDKWRHQCCGYWRQLLWRAAGCFWITDCVEWGEFNKKCHSTPLIQCGASNTLLEWIFGYRCLVSLLSDRSPFSCWMLCIRALTLFQLSSRCS